MVSLGFMFDRGTATGNPYQQKYKPKADRWLWLIVILFQIFSLIVLFVLFSKFQYAVFFNIYQIKITGSRIFYRTNATRNTGNRFKNDFFGNIK